MESIPVAVDVLANGSLDTTGDWVAKFVLHVDTYNRAFEIQVADVNFTF